MSNGEFAEALQSLVGERAAGLSAYVVVRLKERWCVEYEKWSRRNLAGKAYFYVWADGIHAKVRMEDDPPQRTPSQRKESPPKTPTLAYAVHRALTLLKRR